MTTIAANLQVVRQRIAAACAAAGRAPASVTLLAVSKTWPAVQVRAAVACGQRAFGESYVQEATDKIAQLRDLVVEPRLEWHFIGPLQSNKTRTVAERFDWLHSLDRAKLAERLSAQRPAALAPLQVCIEVNVSGEASKSGCAPEEAAALAQAVARLPNLTLRGLMAIPEPTEDIALLRSRFALLRQLQDRLNAQGLALDTLSMGMSHDLEAAILEGATIVRVGTAIFGER
ncbi:putative enzyme [Georgfuchsia toluolica]|uniref:Pyridoxal phosphate homeostasis protein n=1 Tax=Georgfuchsia toluolica TaxID=424218 RepID=A0A916N3H5_9PROT|nr:YggS family pyridoxal phosphate-dependent enzyme [Georgfuchsia toluolica]CAG4885056.1 putative enzyme [Georgfuchsia toluolica]